MSRTFGSLCVLICCCLLFSYEAVAEEAFKGGQPPPTPNNCTYLNVNISSSSTATVSSSGVGCDHGYLYKILPSQTNTTQVVLQQSSAFGPNCLVTITAGSNTAVVRAQQNYCAAEAGNITASVVSGNATVSNIQPGSYGNSVAGQFTVTMN